MFYGSPLLIFHLDVHSSYIHSILQKKIIIQTAARTEHLIFRAAADMKLIPAGWKKLTITNCLMGYVKMYSDKT